MVYNLNLDRLGVSRYTSLERVDGLLKGKCMRNQFRRLCEDLIVEKADYSRPCLLITEAIDDAGRIR